jgi:hypothetical protein
VTGRDPGPEPPTNPNCTCGPWTVVNGHWTRIVNEHCPIDGEP